MIKTIVFDYAEVIAEGPMSKWVRENIYPDDSKLVAYREKAHKWDLGEMSLKEVYKHLGEITGIAPELIWENFYEKSLPNNEVIDLIKQLKKNYNIILFSNFVAELLRKLLNKYEITELFDEIIISSEHKMKKPDPKFFELLVRRAGVNKDEIIFIDDKLRNILAANEFGIKAFQFINAQQLAEDLRTQGVKI